VAQPNKPWTVLLGQYMSLALLLPSSSLLGYFLGYLLDRAFGTHYLKIVLLILGSVGGLIQLVRQVSRDTGDDGS
jgi:F0F1-type ATP synthase assembly protein I